MRHGEESFINKGNRSAESNGLALNCQYLVRRTKYRKEVNSLGDYCSIYLLLIGTPDSPKLQDIKAKKSSDPPPHTSRDTSTSIAAQHSTAQQPRCRSRDVASASCVRRTAGDSPRTKNCPRTVCIDRLWLPLLSLNSAATIYFPHVVCSPQSSSNQDRTFNGSIDGIRD